MNRTARLVRIPLWVASFVVLFWTVFAFGILVLITFTERGAWRDAGLVVTIFWGGALCIALATWVTDRVVERLARRFPALTDTPPPEPPVLDGAQ